MSNPKYNAWLGLSAAFQGEMVDVILDGGTAVTFPLINDLQDETKAFLAGIHDAGAMDRMFRKWGAADYRCWNCYVAQDTTGMGKIKTDLDALVVAYPTDFSILGVWHYEDGRPQGDPPNYPQPAQTINFMPDVDNQGTRPTELSNVLLMFGQPPRIFNPA